MNDNAQRVLGGDQGTMLIMYASDAATQPCGGQVGVPSHLVPLRWLAQQHLKSSAGTGCVASTLLLSTW